MLQLSQPVLLVSSLLAAYLMVTAGLAKRRLVWRSRRCDVCHRPVDQCVCRWR
jgi:hypothetical protein